MKKVFFLTFIANFLFADVTYILNVKNMGCGGCAKKIIAATENIAKVKDYKPDFKTKDLILTFGEDVDIKEIVAKINEAGYKAIQQ
ncbi:heavy-metal-associated domain-containing protein [Campylobacter sp. MG1]|uniref:heavy-metal-associated domain-containing protein n=1 Tax=Campylobacter sp. MG1 TaxID=2976332 RepID=UPI00226D240F|nr:heavy-metal-associated domain-containing protein [Campylobacter sp. MG1]